MREFLRLIATLLIAGAALSQLPGTAHSSADRPNILFIMVDDLGPEWISCYGAEDVNTPVIDALASRGMRFTNAYSMPKCTPTRATLLTGQYPFRHGWVNHWDVPRWGAGCHFDPKHNVSFARLLRDAGYATCIAGKWQINDFRVQPNVLEEHGFDEWCMWTGFESGNRPSGKRYWDPYIHTRDGSKTYPEKFGADVFTDFIIDFMRQHAADPMMIYFPMALTHGPLVHTPAELDAKGNLAKHKAMVRYVDLTVGRIVKALDELKIRERTLVVFSTDNGTSRGIKGTLNGRQVEGGKGSLGESGCWAPFIVNGPGLVPEGVVTDCLTDFTDLFPTFCELAHAEVPSDLEIDGHSIADVILGQSRNGTREWIMAMGGGVARLTREGRVVPAKPYASRAIRDRRYKLWIDDQGSTEKVVDLQADPAEQANLIASNDPQVIAARENLETAAAQFPKQDGKPRYDPTPPQSWDRKVGKAQTGRSTSKETGQASFPIETQWGEVRWRRDGLELHVRKSPDKGVVSVPRLNNPIAGVYVQGDAAKKPLKFQPDPTEWRITLPESQLEQIPLVVMLETKGQIYVPKVPRVVRQSTEGSVTLAAHDAVTHGKLLRYEPQPHKNTVGYWANEKDWCEWQFKIDRPGKFHVDVLQGCGKGQGGSVVSLVAGDQSIQFTVEDTGHFQNFKERHVGMLEFSKPGPYTLKIKPIKKAAGAIMDVRSVRLRPSTRADVP